MTSLFLASPGLAIVAPIVGDIRDHFAVGNMEAALVVSIFGIARMLTDLPAGLLADRLPKVVLTLAGLACLLAGSIMGALAASFDVLLAGRALTGMGSGLVMTSAIAWAAALAPPGGQARLISRLEATWMTSATLSPVIGGGIAGTLGWRATFWYCAVTALLSAALLGTLAARAGHLRDRPPKRARSGSALRLVTSRPVAAAYLAGFTIFFNRNGVRNTLLPLFAATVIGLAPAAIGVTVAVVAAVTVVTTLLGGRLADALGRRPVLLAGLAILVVGNLALLGASSPATLLLAGVVVGLGGVTSSVPAAMIMGAVPSSQVGGAVGGYRFVQDAGFVVGPLAIGAVLDRAGYHAGLLFAAGAVLTGLVAIAWLLARDRRAPIDPEGPTGR